MIRIKNLRLAVQHLSFIVLMYGGRFGIHLGPALPCFACPYVTGCGGYCYLMGLQGYIGFGLSGAAWLGLEGLQALGYFLMFAVLVAFLGKAWCGWLCPFGLLSDWLTWLRCKLGLRERRLSPGCQKVLAPIKYLLLIYLAAIPIFVTIGLLHEDSHLPFCNICPGKTLLPLFVGETKYLALDLNNSITLGFSLALLFITGAMLTGMFFSRRFFCRFCPLLALIHLLKPLTFLRLYKEPENCTGCGNCRRACPMNIQKVYEEKIKTDVQTADCLDCGMCAESCVADSALSLNFYKRKLFSSSCRYAAGLKGKRT